MTEEAQLRAIKQLFGVTSDYEPCNDGIELFRRMNERAMEREQEQKVVELSKEALIEVIEKAFNSK